MKKIIALIIGISILLSAFNVSALSDEVVIDNDNANNSGVGEVVILGAEVTEDSTTGIVTESGGEYGGYYKAGRNLVDAEISFSYQPELRKGKYEVFVNRPYVHLTNPDMKAVVYSMDGSQEVVYSIKRGAMESDDTGYISIGEFNFSGNYGVDKVVISKEAGVCTTSLQWARWDSVKFVYKGAVEVPDIEEPAENTGIILLDHISANNDESVVGRAEVTKGSVSVISNANGYGGVISRSVGYNLDQTQFTYFPRLEEGKYRVFMHKNYGTGWGSVNCLLKHAEGEFTTVLNWGLTYDDVLVNDSDGNKWYPFGDFNFTGVYGEDSMMLSTRGSDLGYGYFDAMLFVPVRDLELNSFYANGKKAEMEIPWGYDTLRFDLNNMIADTSYSVVSVSDNKTLDSDVKFSGNSVYVYLKESLCNGVKYRVDMRDITDVLGNELSTSYEFTAGEDNGYSTAYTDVKKSRVVDGVLHINGVVQSSKYYGIKGRDVILKIKHEDSDEYTEVAKVISGQDGVWEIEYEMPAEPGGLYYAQISSDFVGEEKEFSFAFISESMADDIIFPALAQTSDVSEVEALFDEIIPESFVDFSNISDKTKVFDDFIGSSYSDVEDFYNDLNTIIALEEINQNEDTEFIASILSDEEKCVYLGIDFGVLEVITNNRDSFLTAVAEMDRFENVNDLIEGYNSVVNEYLSIEYNKNGNEIIIESKKVKVGQGVDFTLKLENEVSDVKEIYYEFECDKNIFDDFFVTSDADAEIEKSYSDKKAQLKLIFDEPASNLVDVAKISFTAVRKAIGTNTIEAKGMITYYVGESDFTITHNINTDDFTVKIYEATLVNNSGGGGGSSDGGYRAPAFSQSTQSSGGKNENTEQKPVETQKPQDTVVFNDLESVEWAKESILGLYTANIVSGVGNNSFAPGKDVKREEFAKMLTLTLGMECPKTEDSFTDTISNEWYVPYIAAVEKYGVVNGYENGSFGIGVGITRQEMATMIYRAVEAMGTNIKHSDTTERFADDEEISEYAKEAVYWLKENGLISGMGDNLFAPHENVTRAMAAKLLYGLLKG